MTGAREERVFHSACLLAAYEGQPLVHRAYGGADLESVFDLASLTKPLATAAVAMQLCARGQLGLEDRLGELVPSVARLPAGRARVRQLLAHCAGLRAWQPFYERVTGTPPRQARRRVRRLAASEPLESAPGRRGRYSDLGFILLDWALERAAGQRLDQLAARHVYRPLALSRTGFVDLSDPAARERALRRWSVVPTERRPGRPRLLAEVHDDNCRAMGGVSGHAGLFGSAHDIHLIVRELLAARSGGRSIFDGEVVRRFLAARPLAGSSWALGWDRPEGSPSSAGRRFGARSVGHLGFTGTSIWIDLDRSYWVILLTNRVYHGREPNRLKALRPRLHDAIYACGAVRRALTRRLPTR